MSSILMLSNKKEKRKYILRVICNDNFMYEECVLYSDGKSNLLHLGGRFNFIKVMVCLKGY